MTNEPKFTTTECENGETFTLDEMAEVNEETWGPTYRDEMMAIPVGESRYFDFVLTTRVA